MNKPQIIHDAEGNPAFAVIPWTDYKAIAPAEAEAALSDEELYDSVKAKEADDEAFPIEVADRLLRGDNPIKVFREFRKMTQKELAEAAHTNPIYLSQLERGTRGGSTKLLQAIAEALGVTIDDLV